MLGRDVIISVQNRMSRVRHLDEIGRIQGGMAVDSKPLSSDSWKTLREVKEQAMCVSGGRTLQWREQPVQNSHGERMSDVLWEHQRATKAAERGNCRFQGNFGFYSDLDESIERL
jgi:hypothetical protein